MPLFKLIKNFLNRFLRHQVPRYGYSAIPNNFGGDAHHLALAEERTLSPVCRHDHQSANSILADVFHESFAHPSQPFP